jgi:hypothetical protein
MLEDLTVNEHYKILRTISGKSNIDFVSNAFINFFHNIVISKQTYLPNSMQTIPFYQELSVLFWRFLSMNKVMTLLICIRCSLMNLFKEMTLSKKS